MDTLPIPVPKKKHTNIHTHGAWVWVQADTGKDRLKKNPWATHVHHYLAVERVHIEYGEYRQDLFVCLGLKFFQLNCLMFTIFQRFSKY